MNTGAPTMEIENSTFSVEYLQNPNRLWALPMFGGAAKLVIVILVSLRLTIVDLAAICLRIINGFVVLFIGRYPESRFRFMVYTLRLQLRLSAFTFGLSDTYPLFDEEGLGPDDWGPGRHDRVYRPLGPETFR